MNKLSVLLRRILGIFSINRGWSTQKFDFCQKSNFFAPEY